MKKHLILFVGLLVSFAGLALTSVPQAVKAAGVYHTVKSKSANNISFHWNGSTNAYLWNDNLTQKKHHLTNYPKTTWYAAKVLKMTNGTKTGTFYYVTNQSEKTKGYVWKGYLTRGAYSSNSTVTSNNPNKGANTKWITKGNPSGIPYPTEAELDKLKYATSDEPDFIVTYYQDQPVIKAFTGTTYNDKLDDVAMDEANGQFGSVIKHEWGDKLNDIQYVKLSAQLTNQQMQNLANGSPTFKRFVLNDLTKQHIKPSNYKGWQIDMFSEPIYQKELLISNGQNPRIGEYVIALYKP